MANVYLEDLALDRSQDYKRLYRESKRLSKKLDSRNLEVAMNLFLYLEETPGMTRSILAEMLGVSQAYLCKLINGKVNLTLKTIEKYEKVLSINLLPTMKENEVKRRPLISFPKERIYSSETFYFSIDTNSSYSSNIYNNGNSIQIYSY